MSLAPEALPCLGVSAGTLGQQLDRDMAVEMAIVRLPAHGTTPVGRFALTGNAAGGFAASTAFVSASLSVS